jgi:hypothetical protein
MRDDKIKTPYTKPLSIYTAYTLIREAGDACAPRNTQTHREIIATVSHPMHASKRDLWCVRVDFLRNLLPCDIAILAWLLTSVGDTRRTLVLYNFMMCMDF